MTATLGALIAVETDDLDSAARQTTYSVAEPLSRAVASLCAQLSGTAAMAGSDPAGTAWAAGYDRAAASAVQAGAAAAEGCFRIAGMLAQTADNYRRADSASTLGGGTVASRTLAELGSRQAWTPPPGAVPPAAGGSTHPPAGWWLVQHTVGYVWPDGHQDRLRAAAAAWRRSGARLEEVAGAALFPAIPFCVDRLPEADDVLRVTHALHAQLGNLADAHRRLGACCDGLAAHIDEMHAAVEGELRSLIEWSAGIQIGGGLLSLVSFGSAEVAAQGVQATRIAAAAARVAAILERFAALVRVVADEVAAVADRAVAVSAGLRTALGARLSEAAVELVGRYPALAAVQERFALLRLTSDVGEARLPLGAATDRGSIDAGIGSRHAGRHQFPYVGSNKSQFFDDQDLRELADTRGQLGVRQLNRNLRYVLHARDDVGVDRATGIPTNVYTVIRRPDGSLLTMYPGLSPER